jgi:hypothetical protein
MAEPTPRPPVKLICGMIASDTRRFVEVRRPLADAFGEVDLLSETFDFDATHYYDDEMGWPLFRQFVSFAAGVAPDALADAKCTTNAIERRLAAGSPAGPRRPINLDPGYLEPAKLVLASMKNASHRIYLARGVYAEVTLRFAHGRWQPLPWTFPDFASGAYWPFLDAARRRLRRPSRREAVP